MRLDLPNEVLAALFGYKHLLDVSNRLKRAEELPAVSPESIPLIKPWQDVTVPFLCVPGALWPPSLTAIPGTCFGHLNRPANEDMIDFEITVASSGSALITGEAKNYNSDTMKKAGAKTIRGIIERAAAKTSNIHLVFATNLDDFHPLKTTADGIEGVAAANSIQLLTATIVNDQLAIQPFKSIAVKAGCSRCIIFVDPDAERSRK